MGFKRSVAKHASPAVLVALLVLTLTNFFLSTPVFAQDDPETRRPNCTPVGGTLLTNIGVIPTSTNLGPVSGDLAGSVAATILGQNGDGTYNLQHYYVTASGDTITSKIAVLSPTYPTGDPAIVAVPWGHYRSIISGGTGKFTNASGYLDYFGMADFHQNTLVLRYRGQVCYAR